MIPNGYNIYPDNYLLEQSLASSSTTGVVYFVDANAGVDTNDGLSWETCFKTLTVAMAASHANIAASSSGWANRNKIYYKGDNNEASKETLTTLAQKTDIIGVGSYDHNPFPILIGNHVIVGSFMGCRFINMGFQSLAAGGVIMTVPTTVSGMEFIGCSFYGSTAVVATKAILATAVEMLKISGCRFIGRYSTATIDIGAGESNGMLIENNLIESAAIGIKVSSTMTATIRFAMIKNNIFDVGTLCITDGGGNKVRVVNNSGVTLAADSKLASVFVASAALSCNNLFTCGTGVTAIYPPQAAITAP